jgi:hypothetical protein
MAARPPDAKNATCRISSGCGTVQHFEITEQDTEQEDHETHCGQLTLAFGKVFELYGREAAEKI